jgi:hypothetical protein
MKPPAVCFALAVFIAASTAHAGVVARHSLVDLVNYADLIVVGTASHGIQTGEVLGFALQLDRVLKGDPTLAGTTIHADWALRGVDEVTNQLSPQAVSGTGLWFLRNAANGWVLLPVSDGYLQVSDTFIPTPVGPISTPYSYGSAATAVDKVAAELCAAVEAADGGGTDFYTLHLGLLDQLGSPVIQVLYRRMATSSSPKQKILGLSGLIRAGSAAALTSVASSDSLLGQYPIEEGVLLGSIRNTFRAADPVSISVLGQAATSTKLPIPLRTAAAHALASIHTTTSLPYLATLLNDASSDLQAEAIGGFSAFANGLPVQTSADVPSLRYLQLPDSAPYKTADTVANFAMGSQAISQNEATYLSFWRAWWLQHRSDLGY